MRMLFIMIALTWITGISFLSGTMALANDVGEMKNSVLHVTPTEAKSLLDANPSIRVLDVRTRTEFNRGHVDGATQINYFSLKLKKKLSALDKNTTWLVHCKSGHRSGRVVPQMKKLGFTKIIHMDGGFDGWKKAGLSIAR